MLLKWYSFFLSIISVTNLNDCFGIPFLEKEEK